MKTQDIDESGEDEVTRLDEVLKYRKPNLNGMNTKFNIFSNRNSFYFRSKLNCYNNKLRDLKTNQLIPSFNYFFLKPSNNISQKASNSTILNTCSQETSNILKIANTNTNTELETNASNLPQIDLVNTLELIRKHIYKLQAFDFKYKDASTRQRRSCSRSRDNSTDSSSMDTSHGIPIISGKQAKKLSRKLAKSKKNLSDPNLSVVMRRSLDGKAINNAASNSTRRRKRFLNMSGLSGFLKRLLGKAPKSNVIATTTNFKRNELDKNKSMSFDNIMSSKNGFDEISQRKSTQPSIGVSDMIESNITDLDIIQQCSDMNSYKPPIQIKMQKDALLTLNEKTGLKTEKNFEFTMNFNGSTEEQKENLKALSGRLNNNEITKKRHLSDTAIFSGPINPRENHEPFDKTLRLFLMSERSGRRSAICSRIDKIYYNRQLINYMEYLLREDYIKNFLL